MFGGLSGGKSSLTKILQGLKQNHMQHSGHNYGSQLFQTELMAEIYSKSEVRAFVKYYS